MKPSSPIPELQSGPSGTDQVIVQNRAYFLKKETHPWLSLFSFLLILLIWEGVGRLQWIPPLFLPPPSGILAEGWAMAKEGTLVIHILASLKRILWGFLLASFLGIGTGILIGFFRTPEAIGNPILAATFPIPKIAILPLLILWLGIGEAPKIAVIALGVFFPMAINVYTGVKNVDPLLIKAALSLGSTRSRIIYKVIFPSILPMIFAGMKLGMGIALLLVVAAEMVAADAGIGFMILNAADLMQTSRLMVGLIILSLLGIFFNWLFQRLERIIIPWKH
ncbi:MAG TPA: ABC transporter permease [Thermodesulfobacteriota bacterium]|nr:ABC transporter permease [Thermodesulfobacteriota bacterium]